MKAERSCCVSYHLYRYDGTEEVSHGIYGGYPHPRDIPLPKGVKEWKWVPQTIYDSIWKIMEFETVELLEEFIKDPGVVHEEAVISRHKQPFFNHWIDGELSSPDQWS